VTNASSHAWFAKSCFLLCLFAALKRRNPFTNTHGKTPKREQNPKCARLGMYCAILLPRELQILLDYVCASEKCYSSELAITRSQHPRTDKAVLCYNGRRALQPCYCSREMYDTMDEASGLQIFLSSPRVLWSLELYLWRLDRGKLSIMTFGMRSGACYNNKGHAAMQ
jgi:hypothetical protein